MADRLPRGWNGYNYTPSEVEDIVKTYTTYRRSAKDSYSRTRKGWVELDDGRKYYLRSGWEMKYAAYLEMLKDSGAIKYWEYEVDTFWFENIKRGVRSYTPDFKVFFNDGDVQYHEVKGWMDAKSKTKLKRMAKYHPEIDLVVIGEKEMKALGLI